MRIDFLNGKTNFPTLNLLQQPSGSIQQFAAARNAPDSSPPKFRARSARHQQQTRHHHTASPERRVRTDLLCYVLVILIYTFHACIIINLELKHRSVQALDLQRVRFSRFFSITCLRSTLPRGLSSGKGKVVPNGHGHGHGHDRHRHRHRHHHHHNHHHTWLPPCQFLKLGRVQ